VLQYLEERGYLRIDELPRDLAAIVDDGRVEEIVVRWLARGMGREGDAELRKRLSDLLDGSDSEEKLARAYEKAGIDREALEARMKTLPSGLVPLDFGTDPLVELILRTGVEPVDTNGFWSEKERAVRFETTLDAGHVLAPLAYALWSVPDDAWQKAHLGRVAVEGEKLLDLALWEAGLAPEPRAAWDRALDALDPAKDLRAQLRAIRVTDPDDDDPEKGAETILESLEIPEAGD
jgi:hypothetical protein